MSRRAYFLLSTEMLKRALMMPVETEVIGADWDFNTDSLKVYVEDVSLEEVPAGQILPCIRPTLTRDLAPVSIGVNGATEFRDIYTWRWNSGR